MASLRQLEAAHWTDLQWSDMDALFAAHMHDFEKRKSGMHVALLGTTRGGKTTLATGGESQMGILRHWENALVLDTTGDPGPINQYGKPLKRFGAIKGHMRLTVNDGSERSREKVYRAINKAVHQGNCVIYGDETRQLADRSFFNLGKLLDHVWLFCAKQGVSFVGGTQAPRFVPSPLYDQSKFHFFFHNRDRRAMKRLAEVSGDVDTLEVLIPQLERYEFAAVDPDGDVYRSKFELKKVVQRQEQKRDIRNMKFAVVDSKRRRH